MKNLTTLIVSVLFVGLIFSGCSKDDDEKSRGSFKVDGKSYSLSKGIIESAGEWSDGVHGMFVILASDGLKLSVSEWDADFSGKGHMIILGLYSPESDGLALGTYEYDYYSEEVFTFDVGGVVVNMDFSTEDADAAFKVDAGTVKVKESGSNYSLEFAFYTDSGDKITGSYSGPLKFYSENFIGSTKSVSQFDKVFSSFSKIDTN